MSRLTPRDLIRVLTRSVPAVICAALISLHVLPDLVVVWWLLMLASATWSIVMAARDGHRRVA